MSREREKERERKKREREREREREKKKKENSRNELIVWKTERSNENVGLHSQGNTIFDPSN